MEGAASSEVHGRYRVIRRLGVGGMAETFVAEREGPGGFVQRVCLKRILPAFANDAEFVRLFLQEARLAARLRHNNIVGVLDFGREESGYFLALELIEGADLRKLLRTLPEHRLPIPVAVLIAGDVALALEYAHALGGEGIVHRDISPSNILLSQAGEVKLGDFGIAKAMQGAGATATNSLKGKIPYMAPEQMRMTDIDGRSDLFALGVVLYEMLAGRRPFDGGTDVQTMTRIMQGEREPIRRQRPDVPPPLARIVDRLLHPDRDRRYRDAGELLDALSPLLPSTATRRQLARMVDEAAQASKRQSEPVPPEGTGARAGEAPDPASEPRSVSNVRAARADVSPSAGAEPLPTRAEGAPTIADISAGATVAMTGLPAQETAGSVESEPRPASPEEATRTRLPSAEREPTATAPPVRKGAPRIRKRKATLPLQALVGEAGVQAHERALQEASSTGPSAQPTPRPSQSPPSPPRHEPESSASPAVAEPSSVHVDAVLLDRQEATVSEPDTQVSEPDTHDPPRRRPPWLLPAAGAALLLLTGVTGIVLLFGGDAPRDEAPRGAAAKPPPPKPATAASAAPAKAPAEPASARAEAPRSPTPSPSPPPEPPEPTAEAPAPDTRHHDAPKRRRAASPRSRTSKDPAPERASPQQRRTEGGRRYRTVGRIPAGAPAGKLGIRCIPWGDVWVDGIPVGRSPVYVRVRAGSRRIECGQGARRVPRTVHVRASVRRRVEIDLSGRP